MKNAIITQFIITKYFSWIITVNVKPNKTTRLFLDITADDE